MRERRCRYCQQVFQPSKFQPRQTVCSGAECQRKRRTEYHKDKIDADPEYREVCRDSRQKWRARHPSYWKQYREKHPEAVERNRQQQKFRDRKRRFCNLANNSSALDLKHSTAQVWLVSPDAAHLANNNSAPAQIWVIEPLGPRAAPLA
jgi:CRISPR/Cas system-associated endonuclease/helicase Cas3